MNFQHTCGSEIKNIYQVLEDYGNTVFQSYGSSKFNLNEEIENTRAYLMLDNGKTAPNITYAVICMDLEEVPKVVRIICAELAEVFNGSNVSVRQWFNITSYNNKYKISFRVAYWSKEV